MHTVMELAVPADEGSHSACGARVRAIHVLAHGVRLRPSGGGGLVAPLCAAGTGHGGSRLPPICMGVDELTEYRSRHPSLGLF